MKEKPEILKLRFDPERSPIDSIPLDLRHPVWKIYLKYTDGMVLRKGRQWQNFSVFNSQDIEKPYSFEIASENKDKIKKKVNGSDQSSHNYYWGELNWPQAKERFKIVDIALLPVGSIEQHGPHLPLDTDAFDAEYLTKRVAMACSDPRPLVLPLISYGVSYEHDEFPGTIGIRNDTLANLVFDIGIAIAKNGINKMVIINAHGGNTPALNYAAQMINRTAKIFVCVDSGETSDVDITAIARTLNDVHAGEIETSTSLAIRPQLVDMEKAVRSVPHFSNRYLNFSSKRQVQWYAYTSKVSELGVIGDAQKGSAQKGEKIWQIMIAHLVALVEDLKQMSLEELHHRQY